MKHIEGFKSNIQIIPVFFNMWRKIGQDRVVYGNKCGLDGVKCLDMDMQIPPTL